MDINALHKDELEFELACRGILNCKTVATMRKFLREILRREASGESSIAFKAPTACVESPDQEVLTCKCKLTTLVALVSEIRNSSDKKALCRRVHSRLLHLSNRSKLIAPIEPAVINSHMELCRDIEKAMLSLTVVDQEESEDEDLISDHDRNILMSSLGEEAAEILGQLEKRDITNKVTVKESDEHRGHVAYTSALASLDPHAAPSTSGRPAMLEPMPDIKDCCNTHEAARVPRRLQELQRSSTLDHSFHRRKLIPIKDWGVKFSGRGTISVNAFLERIDELKDARNADDEDLYRYAIDLFEDEALIWFRANKNLVSTWSELVELLVDTFQKPNYQDELLEEIKQRTQSRQESVVIYMSIMQNMFNRLPIPLSELQKLFILRKNLQPYFQKEICRDTFSSVVELTSVLRIIEQTKISCDNFKEPIVNTRSLEQDLAYRGTSNAVQSQHGNLAVVENRTGSQSKCWNCRAPGHRFRECNLPRQRLFCYKCGRFGISIQNCTCNNAQEGNERAESMPANQTPRN